MLNLLLLVAAYLIGSLSPAILIAKYLKLPDPRLSGSGNAGATNILRLAGKNQAAVVLTLDLIKGLIIILIARALGSEGTILALMVLAVVTGHIFPIFHQFKGGKGMATLVGALLALSFLAGLLAATIWIVVAFFSRYASLASLSTTCASPILILIFSNPQYTLPVALTAVLIIWRHWNNIKRLINGKESKISFIKR